MREETVEGGRWEDAISIKRNSKLKETAIKKKQKKIRSEENKMHNGGEIKKDTTRKKEDERMNLGFEKGQK